MLGKQGLKLVRESASRQLRYQGMGTRINKVLDPPILDLQRIAERFHPLVVRRVARDKPQPMLKGDCGYHGVGASNRLSGALKIRRDASGQLSAPLIECQDLYMGKALQ